MKISEAIKELEAIKSEHGDVGLHLEVGENTTCGECGEPKYVMFCGMCKRIGTINVETKVYAWLIADRG